MLWLAARIRDLCAWLDLAVFTVAMALLARLPLAWLTGWYPRLFQRWCRAFVRALGVDLRLHQHYTGRLPERYILIANHPSAFEDIGIPALFPVTNLAKAEVRHWWIVGRIATAAGTLFVQREDKDSRQAAQAALIAAVRAGHNVAIYPEGGCKGDCCGTSFSMAPSACRWKPACPLSRCSCTTKHRPTSPGAMTKRCRRRSATSCAPPTDAPTITCSNPFTPAISPIVKATRPMPARASASGSAAFWNSATTVASGHATVTGAQPGRNFISRPAVWL
ncbi:lysophospholipid acyltransferase family protein [Chitiniphilus eburneus]|uniref:Phospholipid/glycerol acyltransferase domain-containing protein n=1 Tax=Chitiniphilus eburneus TaxID=2571148 RepID=A0A4U0PWM2_9NEIS|nr:lysophospholipid acyltransferase family protein [Chitiniphilus eburneus]TJZ72925.1 hypothetical protein FAZ21_12860 [Chitiniphilus eburneus]